MKRIRDRFRRIAFVFSRGGPLVRSWFRGTMAYQRTKTNWFVRVFETSRERGKPYLPFGPIAPEGVIACGVPVRAVQAELRRQGAPNVPVLAVPQAAYPGIGSVFYDADDIARQTIRLFQLRGCVHLAYVGAQASSEIRASRAVLRAFRAVARQKGIPVSVLNQPATNSMGIRIALRNEVLSWLNNLPKPCGILTWNDHIGRDLLDLCRYDNIAVSSALFVIGLLNDELICENSTPTLTSVELDLERTAYHAAKALDEIIDGKYAILPHLACGVKAIVERATTQDARGGGRLVSLAREYIVKNACREGGINQSQIAAHLGVSVRTLQLRFRDVSNGRTILQEIHSVQLKEVCRLLSTTRRSLTEITFAAGFGSISRLKALFRETFGMSMREYRAQTLPPPHRKKGGKLR